MATTGHNTGLVAPKRGEIIRATFLNDLTMQVNRNSRFIGRNSIVNGAGVFTRPDDSGVGSTRKVLKLQSDFHRTAASVTGEGVEWDGSDYATGTGDIYNIDGKFFRGYAFEDELVEAIYHSAAETWFAVGSGHTFVRGTLEDTLSDAGTQTLNLTQWNGSAWEDWESRTVTLRESVGLDTGVDANAVVLANWYENHGDNAGLWIPTQAACETT